MTFPASPPRAESVPKRQVWRFRIPPFPLVSLDALGRRLVAFGAARFAPDLLALAIGGAACLAILGFHFVVGDSPFWHTPAGDPAGEQAGYLYFVRDSWRFPLFDVPLVNQHEGTNVL